jgi:hypothetical protein
MIPLLVPIGIAALGYGAYKLHQKAPMKAIPYTPPPNPLPTGYAQPTPVTQQVVTSPQAVYTLVPGDIMQMVGRRFTFNRQEFDEANPGYLAQFNISPTSSGLLFHHLDSRRDAGNTINLPPKSLDNGKREMAMGDPIGIVAPGITREMVPNAPGVTDVQGALIRETLAASQKAGTAQSETSAQISYWLNVIKR